MYAWGKNDKGQLLSNSTQNINSPVKVKLPENHEVISCSGDHTFVRNVKTDQIFVNKFVEGKLELELVSENKIWWIGELKNHGILYICSPGETRIPQALSEVPVHHKKEKLRTAKNIIDKIQWDEHLKKE